MAFYTKSAKLIVYYLNKFNLVVERIFLVLASIFLITLMVFVCMNVFFRSFLGISLPWTIEFSEYTLLYITFLVAPFLLRHNDHVNFELVYNVLGPRLKHYFNIIIFLIGIIICLLLTYYGIKVTWENYIRNIVLPYAIPMPKYLLFVVIPLSGFLMLSEFICKLLTQLFQIEDTKSHEV